MLNGHLSFEQIEELSDQEEGQPAVSGEESWSHVEICVQCSNLLKKCREVNSKLALLRFVDNRPETDMTCPNENIWLDILAGSLSSEESLRLLQHAGVCVDCGKKLRSATRIFDDSLSSEDERLLNSLPSSQPQAQRDLANRLSGMARPRRQPETLFRSYFKPLAGAIGAAAAVSVAILIMFRDPTAGAKRVVAQVYSQDRMIQLRIPLASYGKLQQKMSGGQNSLAVTSAAFRKALDDIDDAARRHPGDPRWQILSAELALVDWRYRDALPILDRLPPPEKLSKTAARDFRLTRALALYEQGESEKREASFGEAQGLLGDVLADDPGNVVALFNRAILCERLSENDRAAEAWQRLIDTEKDPGWKDEALRHLRALEEKKNPAH